MIVSVKKSNHCKIKIPSGTKEWADSNVNICFGCKNNCKYCYAKKMAIRFRRKTDSDWKEMVLNKFAIEKKYHKRKGRIMFPSTHDITPEILPDCIYVLKKLLQVENHVLITSKPNFQCIKEICIKLKDYKEFVQFRFTIGSINNEILRFWEPHAPSYEERKRSLIYAFENGFKTSISIEPFLDKNPATLVKEIEKYVTDSIWIGKMNYISLTNLARNEEKTYNDIREYYSIQNLMNIYQNLADHPKIQWKDSIKKKLNLI